MTNFLIDHFLNDLIMSVCIYLFTESGHDSFEDAAACMELVQWKVKEDLRRGKWILS